MWDQDQVVWEVTSLRPVCVCVSRTFSLLIKRRRKYSALLLMHTHTNTGAHPLPVNLTDKHTHALSLSLISPVSPQWAHCSATLPRSLPRLPPFVTLRIIEYRSLAFAAVCKRVCLRTSVCVCVSDWGPSKVIAMATWAWGPLAAPSQSTGHRGHEKKGGQEGDRGGGGGGGGQEGVDECCSVWRSGGGGEEPRELEQS